MKMSKVMIVGNSIDGFFSFRKELAAELKERGYDVILVFPDGARTEYFAEQGFQMIRVEMERHGVNPLQELALLNAFRRVIKREKPDVVLTYTIKPNIYAGLACRMLGVPYIANITGLGTAVECGGWLQKITLPLYRMGLRKAGMVFFQNAENQRFMLEKRAVNGEHALLPGSGVNLEQHSFETYPEETGGLVFLTIGRIMRDKGTDELLGAAQEIKKEFPNVRFCLIGSYDGDYRDKVECAVKDGVVEFLGQQNDVHSFIKDSHATIHASYHEGMSNVLLESASAGRPVIATDVPGCRETYDDGVSGISCRAGSADDLARAIREFIRLSYAEKAAMGCAGREKMEREFDRRIVIRTYLEEIEKALGAK